MVADVAHSGVFAPVQWPHRIWSFLDVGKSGYFYSSLEIEERSLLVAWHSGVVKVRNYSASNPDPF